MQSKATTVKEYLDSLPADRKRTLQGLRKVIKANLDKKFKEGMQYGMIGYFVPHSVYPDGYHCDPSQPLPFASIASQKNHVGIYLFCIYGNGAAEKRFRQAWTKAGKKLDMGKSCVRVKTLDDVPLDVLGDTIKAIKADDFIAHYEAALDTRRRAAPKKAAKKKVTKAASNARKTTTKKPAAKKKVAKVTRKKSAKR